jgi:adenosyl cobinamide kinase/adenosyl cobinamide phosphate guanylyltransferase
MKLVWGFMMIQQLEENLPNSQGWMNQYIAATADTVVLMVSGSCNYKR